MDEREFPPPPTGICWGHTLYSAPVYPGGGGLRFIYGLFLSYESSYPLYFIVCPNPNPYIFYNPKAKANNSEEPETS